MVEKILTTAVIAILVFGFLVLVHELGHFLAAKWAKIDVLKFAIGIGPTLFKKNKGGTDYMIKLLPVGGYVAMVGEEDDEEGVDNPNAFNKKPVWKRMIVITAGAFMNILTGFIIIMILLSLSKTIATTTVREFKNTGSSSAQQGLMPGDRIMKLDNTSIHLADDIIYFMIYKDDKNTDITVKRGNKTVIIKNVAFPYEQIDRSELTGNSQDKGKSQKLYMTDFFVTTESLNPLSLISTSYYKSVSIVKLVWMGFIDLITGRTPVSDLSGPVGISSAIGTAARTGIMDLLNMIVLISINLGVLNLLPIPALDGGKMLILFCELVTGRRLNPKYEGIIDLAGFTLLMGLIVFVTYNDIVKLITK